MAVQKKAEALTKESFIDRIAEKSGATKTDAKKMLEAFVAVTTDTVAKGGSVNVTGFGKFEGVDRQARNGVNPKTGEKITIEARRSASFKAGKTFKEAVKK